MRDLFKIHDFVTFEIIDLRSNFQRQTSDIKSRYQALQIPYHKDCTPDLIVELGRFSPDIKDCYILDEEYYVRRDYLFHRKEVYKLGSFYQFDCSQLEGPCWRGRIGEDGAREQEDRRRGHERESGHGFSPCSRTRREAATA